MTAAIASPTWQVPYGEIRLSYTEPWPSRHIKTLQSAYRASPFFDHYEEAVSSILLKKYDFLYQLAAEALTFCLNQAACLQKIEITQKDSLFQEEKRVTMPILTAEAESMSVFVPPFGYRSVFGADFDNSVSILDILFCLGPHRLQTYLKSYQPPEATPGFET